jgi:hypothetical protein
MEGKAKVEPQDPSGWLREISSVPEFDSLTVYHVASPYTFYANTARRDRLRA